MTAISELRPLDRVRIIHHRLWPEAAGRTGVVVGITCQPATRTWHASIQLDGAGQWIIAYNEDDVERLDSGEPVEVEVTLSGLYDGGDIDTLMATLAAEAERIIGDVQFRVPAVRWSEDLVAGPVGDYQCIVGGKVPA